MIRQRGNFSGIQFGSVQANSKCIFVEDMENKKNNVDRAVYTGLLVNCTITGTYVTANNAVGCKFLGDYCTVTGNGNKIIGNYATISGDNNTVCGDYCTSKGSNIISGKHSTIRADIGARKQERPEPPANTKRKLPSNGDDYFPNAVIESCVFSDSFTTDGSVSIKDLCNVASKDKRHKSISVKNGRLTVDDHVLKPAPARARWVPTKEDLKEDVKSPDNLKDVCVFCLENVPRVIFLDCAHLALCFHCTDKHINEQKKEICPLCQTKFTELRKVHRPTV